MIYLSGPMSGLPDYNWPTFDAAAVALRSAGHTVVNPAETSLPASSPWTHHMRYDIARLVECDAILMLPGWERSMGARLEWEIALGLKMAVHYGMETLA